MVDWVPELNKLKGRSESGIGKPISDATAHKRHILLCSLGPYMVQSLVITNALASKALDLLNGTMDGPLSYPN
jgi:hypothetical protein